MKRWLRLVIAAGVIAALVVILILVRGGDDPAEPQISTPLDSGERVAILDIARESISSIEVVRDGEIVRLLPSGNGVFTPEYNYDVEWIGSRVNRIVGSAASLNSTRIISEMPDTLGEFGLDNPEIQVSTLLDDGNTIQLDIGNRVPGGAAYYVKTAGSDVVYSVSATWISPFLYTLDDLRNKTLPELDPQRAIEVSIETLDGKTIRAVNQGQDRTAEYSLDALIVVEPYERARGASSTWLEEVFQIVPNLAIVSYVDDAPTDLARYGLDGPRAAFRIADENTTLHMLVGDRGERGRYARMADGGPVFELAGAEDLISTRPYDTVNAFIYIVNIDLMERVVIDTRGTSYELRVERILPARLEDDPVETFYFQDKEMDEELARDLYQWIIGLLVDREAPSKPSGDPEMSIRFTLNNGDPDATISFVPFDSNYHAVVRDGSSEFLITRNKIARLQAALADPESVRD